MKLSVVTYLVLPSLLRAVGSAANVVEPETNDIMCSHVNRLKKLLNAYGTQDFDPQSALGQGRGKVAKAIKKAKNGNILASMDLVRNSIKFSEMAPEPLSEDISMMASGHCRLVAEDFLSLVEQDDTGRVPVFVVDRAKKAIGNGIAFRNKKYYKASVWEFTQAVRVVLNSPLFIDRFLDAPNCDDGGDHKPNYGWEYVRLTDCFFHDIPPYTMGHSVPDASRCNAETLDMAAQCWDGEKLVWLGAGNAWCTYKWISPYTCAGYGGPGYAYKCVDKNDPDYPEPEPEYHWQYVSSGDCAFNDILPYTRDQLAPHESRCDADTLGKAAICWDGAHHRNGMFPDGGCAYKSLAASECSGGHNTGFKYVCIYSGDVDPNPQI